MRTGAIGALDDGSGRANHARRAVVASTIGTMIEWYDFYLYGLVAALVFGKLYFPSYDHFAGTLLSFSTFFLGFVARPFGAVLFGHFGDKIGRKGTLIATLLLMGTSTVLIGFIPTYEAIGIWGGIALTLLRVGQGIGVGGEWGGAITVATEWSQFNNRRGLAGSWPQFGSPLGLLLAVLVLTVVTHLGTPQWFEAFGWRIPFLISAVLIAVGLYIRLGVLETPVFLALQEKKQIAKTPVRDVIRYCWKDILLTCLIRTGQQAPFVLFTTFLLSYGTGTLHFTRPFLFNAVLAASTLSLVTTPLWGYVSDRIGRKRMYLIGAATMLLFAFPYYWMLNTGSAAVVVIAVMLSLAIHDMQYGPQAAFISESFPPNLRYSGASIGYQLASITSGGPAPLIATYLLHEYGTSTAISCYIAGIAAISLIATLMLRDRSRENYGTSDQPVTHFETVPVAAPSPAVLQHP